MAILECKQLTKRYGSGFPVLQGVDLTLPEGRIIGLLGPNGCGKSTLIKLACGLLMPTSGEILVGSEAPGVSTKAKVSYLPEKDSLPSWMRTDDLLSYFADFFADFDRAKAFEMINRLGINSAQRLNTMSKGTKEKVQLILAMSRNAQLYLLDEPIGGVDPAARDYILSTIIQNYSENATLVLSTHLIADVEKILDDVIFISGGQVALHQSVDSIREERGQSVDGLFREVYKC